MRLLACAGHSDQQLRASALLRERLGGSRTSGTEAENIDHVLGARKAVLGRYLFCPRLDGLRLDLNGQPARSADQVVVVARAGAGAKDVLAVGRLQTVGLAGSRKVGERPIHRGQPDGRPPLAQHRVKSLRADKTVIVAKGLAHGLTLPRVAFGHRRHSETLPLMRVLPPALG